MFVLTVSLHMVRSSAVPPSPRWGDMEGCSGDRTVTITAHQPRGGQRPAPRSRKPSRIPSHAPLWIHATPRRSRKWYWRKSSFALTTCYFRNYFSYDYYLLLIIPYWPAEIPLYAPVWHVSTLQRSESNTDSSLDSSSSFQSVISEALTVATTSW